MCRQVYATDGIVYLYPLAEEDKENYMKLLRDTSSDKGFYDDEFKAGLMWQSAVDNVRNIEYSVYDEQGQFCGYVILKDKDTHTPEIGIEIVEAKQNNGIGPRAIKLLAKQKYAEGNVEYFIIRVSSKNTHSKHVMEKLGAIYLEDRQQRLTVNMPDTVTISAEVYDLLQSVIENYNNSLDNENEIIHVYKYTPDLN